MSRKNLISIMFLVLFIVTLACGSNSNVVVKPPNSAPVTGEDNVSPPISEEPTMPPTVTPIPIIAIPNAVGSSCVPTDTLVQEGIVTSVTDGDTIKVNIEGAIYPVRYIGIDTPESVDSLSQEATTANELLVSGKTVLLVKDVSETDRYDRLLRYVFVDNIFVNYDLVVQGFAMETDYPPDTACETMFIQAENIAKANAVGLWAVVPTQVPSPVPTSTTGGGGGGAVVIIDYIFYDGVVKQVESDEYAVIKNTGSSSVNLSGWRLNADDPGQDFYFPSYTLNPGESCRVYTNEIHPESCGFSFGKGSAIWANKGDCGHLYDNTGIEVDEYCYGTP